MAYSKLPTRSSLDLASAADMNQSTENIEKFNEAVMITLTSDFLMPLANVWYKASFDNAIKDERNWLDVANKRIIPDKKGLYLVCYQATMNSTIADQHQFAIQLKKNAGSEFVNLEHVSGTEQGICFGYKIVEMNGTTDYLEGWVRCKDDAAKYVASNAAFTFFQVILLRSID